MRGADEEGVRLEVPLASRSRRLFLSSTAIALVGLPLLTQFAVAATRANSDDLAMLNSAIELERAGIKAYDDAADTGLLSPTVLDIAPRFRADHVAHRDALIGAVRSGGVLVSQNTARIEYPPLRSQTDIIAFALSVERQAASTYLSVIPDLADRRLAQVAAAILGVETTHVSQLAEALGNGHAYPQHFVV